MTNRVDDEALLDLSVQLIACAVLRLHLCENKDDIAAAMKTVNSIGANYFAHVAYALDQLGVGNQYLDALDKHLPATVRETVTALQAVRSSFVNPETETVN